MHTIQVGEFKARFSEMIDSVRAGETIIVAYGRNQEKVAVQGFRVGEDHRTGPDGE